MIIRRRIPCYSVTGHHGDFCQCVGFGYLWNDQYIDTYLAITADGVRTYSDGAIVSTEHLAHAERTRAWVFGKEEA